MAKHQLDKETIVRNILRVSQWVFSWRCMWDVFLHSSSLRRLYLLNFILTLFSRGDGVLKVFDIRTLRVLGILKTCTIFTYILFSHRPRQNYFPHRPLGNTSNIMPKHQIDEDTIVSNVLRVSRSYSWEVYVGCISAEFNKLLLTHKL